MGGAGWCCVGTGWAGERVCGGRRAVLWWQGSECVAACERFCGGKQAVVLWRASESVLAVLIDDGAHHLDLLFVIEI